MTVAKPDQQNELLVLRAADERVDQGPLQQIADAEEYRRDRQQRSISGSSMQRLEQDEGGVHRRPR